MKKVKFKMIISGEECGIDMPVSKDAIIDACGYTPSELIVAYYENGVFYEDSTKSVVLQGASDKVYIDKSTGSMYTYDESTSSFNAIGGNPDTYTKEEVDNKIGDIETVLSSIVDVTE